MVAVALEEGMRRLRDDGLQKVREGLTSIAEVERMTTACCSSAAAAGRVDGRSEQQRDAQRPRREGRRR